MYVVGTLAAPHVIPKWFETRVTLVLASLGLAASCAMLAPFNLPVLLVGLFI